MGLPQVLIEFQTKAVTAIQRSAKGIVALILKDDTGTFDEKIYTTINDVNSADWSSTNKDYIDLVFMGTPTKVIVERIATTATDYNAALTKLNGKKWNYLAIPGIVAGDVTNIASWIKSARDNSKKTYKAVLPHSVSDHEGIIDLETDNFVVGSKTYTTAEYTARIAGILAGLPYTQSSTYYKLSEVTSITESVNPDADIDAGKLICINDGESIKIARGVNSLTTTTVTKGEDFKKIKIVEGIDLVRDDIRDTFNNSYVGKVINNYDNKLLFLASVNAYFKELARIDVLDSSNDNLATIDLDAQKIYLQSKGLDISTMKDQDIKKYNTGSQVFAAANVKFVDAMEDLDFSISM